MMCGPQRDTRGEADADLLALQAAGSRDDVPRVVAVLRATTGQTVTSESTTPSQQATTASTRPSTSASSAASPAKRFRCKSRDPLALDDAGAADAHSPQSSSRAHAPARDHDEAHASDTADAPGRQPSSGAHASARGHSEAHVLACSPDEEHTGSGRPGSGAGARVSQSSEAHALGRDHGEAHASPASDSAEQDPANLAQQLVLSGLNIQYSVG